jgi:hypothetical protein
MMMHCDICTCHHVEYIIRCRFVPTPEICVYIQRPTCDDVYMSMLPAVASGAVAYRAGYSSLHSSV